MAVQFDRRADMTAPPGSVMLVPEAGFCFRGVRDKWTEAGGKVFVNVCSHPRIDPVCGANLVPASEEHLDLWGLGNMRVPVLVGPVRDMKDREGRDATAVDVLFHPAVVHRALNGGKTVTKEHYRDYLIQIATKNINEDHGVVLAPARTELLPTARYKGPNGENSENTHAFPVFASDAEREMDQAATAPRGSGAPGKPIIEEVGTPSDRNRNTSASSSEGIRKGPVIKKGFFGASKTAEIYQDGSSEGIPKPGEQYDPLGHIPESVRTKCHVIDTGAVNGAELDRVTSQYAKTGILDTATEGVYAKGTEPRGKKQVGLGHPSQESSTEKAMKKPAAAKPKPRKKTPEHDIGESTLEGEAAVEVRVRLPKLTGGMASVNLDVGADTVSLSSPEYDLSVQLPHKVTSSRSRPSLALSAQSSKSWQSAWTDDSSLDFLDRIKRINTLRPRDASLPPAREHHPHPETRHTTNRLQREKRHAQRSLCLRTQDSEEKIHQVHVVVLLRRH